MNARLVIPIVGAVLSVVAWLLTRDSHEGNKSQYLTPLGVFIGVYLLGHIGRGVVQGMREASKPNGKQDEKRKQD